MKKFLLAIFAMVTLASAQTGVDFSVKSQYLNRGTLWQDGLATDEGKAVLWSDGWVSANGVTATVWMSSQISDSLKTNEVDLIVGYSKEVAGVVLGAGVSYYTFPNYPEFSQVSSTGEVTLSVAKTIGHVTLGVNAYKDYLMGKGLYVTPTVKTSWALSNFTFNTNTGIGWGSEDFGLYNRGLEHSGVTDVSLDLVVNYAVPVVKGLTVSFDGHSAYQPDIAISNNVGWQGFIYGAGVSYSL